MQVIKFINSLKVLRRDSKNINKFIRSPLSSNKIIISLKKHNENKHIIVEQKIVRKRPQLKKADESVIRVLMNY